jgi:DNA-directed RNA polymerase
MVVPYAGTMHSCLEYTRDAVEEKLEKGYPISFDVKDDKAFNSQVGFLSKQIWNAISEIVLKGKEAMRWFSKVMEVYCKWANKSIEGTAKDKGISWRTPDGFQVIYYSPEEKKHQVETNLDGREQMVLYSELPELSCSNMRAAIAPNFIHSLDATLMRMSIMRGLKKDITCYAMVHDSFGVYASDMGAFLQECVKPAFIAMYDINPMLSLLNNIPPNLELPVPPMNGTLDLSKVLESEFFFS